jgi:hypothetical protein
MTECPPGLFIFLFVNYLVLIGFVFLRTLSIYLGYLGYSCSIVHRILLISIQSVALSPLSFVVFSRLSIYSLSFSLSLSKLDVCLTKGLSVLLISKFLLFFCFIVFLFSIHYSLFIYFCCNAYYLSLGFFPTLLIL